MTPPTLLLVALFGPIVGFFILPLIVDFIIDRRSPSKPDSDSIPPSEILIRNPGPKTEDP